MEPFDLGTLWDELITLAVGVGVLLTVWRNSVAIRKDRQRDNDVELERKINIENRLNALEEARKEISEWQRSHTESDSREHRELKQFMENEFAKMDRKLDKLADTVNSLVADVSRIKGQLEKDE